MSYLKIIFVILLLTLLASCSTQPKKQLEIYCSLSHKSQRKIASTQFFNQFKPGITTFKNFLFRKPKISLDTHIHHIESKDLSDNYIQEYMSNNQVEKAIIISSSYGVYSVKKFNSLSDEARNEYSDILHILHPDQRKKLIDLTDSYISSKPNLMGGCGISLEWEDRKEFYDYCLSKSSMLGIKLHMGQHYSLSIEERFHRINELINGDNKPAFILWHLPIDVNNHTQNISMIDQLYKFVNKHPSISFVVAHALENEKGSLALADYKKRHPYTTPENLFFELSTVFMTENYLHRLEFLEKEVELWRRIGFEHFLYGSDLDRFNAKGETSSHNGRPTALNNLFYSDLLTDIEKKLILYNNGKVFLNRIHKK